jgi:hypothetical protein
LATPLLIKLVIKNFVECFSVIRILTDLLKEEEGLGAHTSIILLLPFLGLEYVWWHKDICPLGEMVSLQCPICRAIRTLTINVDTGKPGAYNVSCLCGWKGRKQSARVDLDMSGMRGKDSGWGKRLVYGSPISYQTIWKAPREFYLMF